VQRIIDLWFLSLLVEFVVLAAKCRHLISFSFALVKSASQENLFPIVCGLLQVRVGVVLELSN
jgi:hypothetical protein